MNNTHLGSCLCGQVQFEVTGTFEQFYLCHCKYCQKDSGSAHAANLFSTHAQLHWAKGEDQVQTFSLPTTRHTKAFCKRCGSALPSHQMDGKLLVVPAGSLDTSLSLMPAAHLFWSSKADWDHDLANLKKFEKLPS